MSTVVESRGGEPIVVERAMWWPGGPGSWHEAHASAGTAQDGVVWALAEGETDSLGQEATYVLIANVSPRQGRARVTLCTEGGPTVTLERDLPPLSRTNIDVGTEAPAVAGHRFGLLVESLGDMPAALAVERAMYWDVAGVRWAAGTSAPATRIR